MLALAAAVIAVFLGYHYGSSDHVVNVHKRAEPVVSVRRTHRYGDILVTSAGFTLYTYKLDTKDHSECGEFCLHVWPPLVVSDAVRPVGAGVGGLGTFERSNGEWQVTYEGLPLYGYLYDRHPGRVSGDAGWWSVVRVSPSPS